MSDKQDPLIKMCSTEFYHRDSKKKEKGLSKTALFQQLVFSTRES